MHWEKDILCLQTSWWWAVVHRRFINLKSTWCWKSHCKYDFLKTSKLNNMFYVADIKMNLMFGSLLSKNNFKLVFESEKLVLSKNRVLIREEYICDGFFKMIVMTIVIIDEKKNNTNVYSSYLLHYFYKWLDKVLLYLIFDKQRWGFWDI